MNNPSRYVLAVLTTFASPVTTAAEQPKTKSSDTAIEELVVTAQRRAEYPLDVPIALRVFDGQELSSRGLNNVQDLQVFVPDLVFTTNTAFGQPYIRGVGSDLLTPGAESSIATFVDGVYQPRSALSIQDFFDIERVEIVKGPQGVLFGRNAVGGAINIYNQAPEDSTNSRISATYGNYDKVRLEGATNLSIKEDKAALRFSGLYAKRDGYTKNVVSGRRINDEDQFAIRGQFRLTPSENSEWLLRAHYSNEDSSRNTAPRINVALGEAIADNFGAIRPESTFETALDEESRIEVESGGVSLDVDWSFRDVTLRSITAYQKSDLAVNLDLDVSQLPFSTNKPRQKANTFSQELLLSSSNTRAFQWLVGGFYLKEDAEQQLNVLLDFPVVSGAPSGIVDSPGGSVDTEAYGLFANGRFEFTERWALSAGVRFSKDKRNLDFLEQVTQIGSGDLLLEIQQDLEETFSEWTPRLVLE